MWARHALVFGSYVTIYTLYTLRVHAAHRWFIPSMGSVLAVDVYLIIRGRRGDILAGHCWLIPSMASVLPRSAHALSCSGDREAAMINVGLPCTGHWELYYALHASHTCDLLLVHSFNG